MELFQTDVEESFKIQEFQDEKVGEYFVQFHDTDFILCLRIQAISILDMTGSVSMYVPSVRLDIQQTTITMFEANLNTAQYNEIKRTYTSHLSASSFSL